MKAATAKEIRDELKAQSPKELLDLCLRLSRFKKENKELLTYLLFHASDEASYLESVKNEIDEAFEQINLRSYYFIKKSVRKVLRIIKKYARYSKKKETEVELLIYFCHKLKDFRPSISRNRVLQNIYDRQLEMIGKIVSTLHEDLQYDFEMEIKKLL